MVLASLFRLFFFSIITNITRKSLHEPLKLGEEGGGGQRRIFLCFFEGKPGEDGLLCADGAAETLAVHLPADIQHTVQNITRTGTVL